MLNRDQILNRQLPARRVTRVPMPEWGGDIWVREFSCAEKDHLFHVQTERGKTGNALVNFRARYVALVASDDKGNRLFTDDDAETLGGYPEGEINRIYQAGIERNSLTQDEVDELEKN